MANVERPTVNLYQTRAEHFPADPCSRGRCWNKVLKDLIANLVGRRSRREKHAQREGHIGFGCTTPETLHRNVGLAMQGMSEPMLTERKEEMERKAN